MSAAVTEAELNLLLSKTPFTRSLGIRIDALGDGECRLTIPFQPSFERPDGRVNGPLYTLAADVGMWCAIMSRLGRDAGAPTVTVEMKTAFLHSARQEDIRCTVRILKWGRRLIYGTAECTTPGGDLLTHHTLTYIRPDAAPDS